MAVAQPWEKKEARGSFGQCPGPIRRVNAYLLGAASVVEVVLFLTFLEALGALCFFTFLVVSVFVVVVFGSVCGFGFGAAKAARLAMESNAIASLISVLFSFSLAL
jgi:hypothetical protein